MISVSYNVLIVAVQSKTGKDVRDRKRNDRLNLIHYVLDIAFVFIMISLVIIFYSKAITQLVRNNIEYTVMSDSRQIADDIYYTIENAKYHIRESAVIIAKTGSENPEEVIEDLIQYTPFDHMEYIEEKNFNFKGSEIGDNTYIGVDYESVDESEAVIGVYTPVEINDTICGYAVGYLKGDKDFKRLLKTSFFNNEVRGFLCDEAGNIVTSTYGVPYGTWMGKLANGIGQNTDDKERYISDFQSEDERIDYYEDKDGLAISSVCRIGNMGWFIVRVVPGSSIDGFIGQFSSKAYWSILGIVTVFIIVMIQIIYRNHKKLNMEMEYSKEVESVNNSLEEERIAMDKIHETLASGSWQIIFDEHCHIQECLWSEGFRLLLGFENEEDFPDSLEAWNTFVDDTVGTEIKDKFYDAALDFSDKIKFDEEKLITTKHEGKKWFQAAGRFLRNEDGRPQVFYGLILDIDERKKNEEKLVSSLKEQIRLQEEADKQRIERDAQFAILLSMSKMYYSMHLIDLNDYSFVEYCAGDMIKKSAGNTLDANVQLKQSMKAIISEDYVEDALFFVDLNTLIERMGSDRIIFIELISINKKWIRAEFILIDSDEEGKPLTVMFTTQEIDEAKRKEENLIRKSTTDEMTALYNRRAYDVDEELVFISFDVNGLKTVNDTLGHSQGDKLIIGAAQCMKQCFGNYGKIYRMGGDEFCAIIFTDKDTLQTILEEFDEAVELWKEQNELPVSVAYGYAASCDYTGKTIAEIEKIADKKMYNAKERYYTNNGIDRRGQQFAYDALCRSYIKILKINLDADSFIEIHVNHNERFEEAGFRDTLSKWFVAFAQCNQVCEEDVEVYNEKINIEFLRSYFDSESKEFHFNYRRLYNGELCKVLLEIIPAPSYKEGNREAYLYVKVIRE